MATVKGLTIDVGVSTSEFNKGLSRMNRDIKSTQRVVNDLSQALKIKFDAKLFSKAQAEAQKVIEKTDNKVQILKDRLEHLEKSGQVDTQHYQQLQDLLIRTEADAHKLREKLKELQELKFDNLIKNINKVGDGFLDVGKAMTPISAVAAGILASFSAIGLITVKTASSLNTLSKQLGVTTDELQKWNYVAMQIGLSNTEVEEGFKKIQQGLAGIQTGNIDKIGQAMLDLGISADDAVHGVAENFEVLIRRIATIENPLIQSSYAIDLFGQNMGARLIPLLQQGSEGLDALIQEFYSFSHLTQENIQDLDNFGNTMNRIKTVLSSFKEEIGLALLPLMEGFGDLMENKVVPIIQKATNWFTALDDRTKKIITTVLLVTSAIAPFLLATGGIIKAVGSMIQTMKLLNGVFTMLSTNPIILTIGIIVGLIILLMNTNEEFKDSIMGLVDTIMTTLQPVLELVMEVFNDLLDALMPIVNMLLDILAPILTLIANYFSFLISAIQPLINMLITLLRPALDIIGWYFERLGDIINKYVVPVFKFLVSVAQGVVNAITKMFEAVIKVVENVVNGIISFINAIIRQINKLAKYLGLTIAELDKVEMSIKQKVEADVSGEIKTTSEVPKNITSDYVRDSITGWTAQTINNQETNYDYSQKDIKIEVIVQNYAEEVDVDDMVRQINLKLAEQM